MRSAMTVRSAERNTELGSAGHFRFHSHSGWLVGTRRPIQPQADDSCPGLETLQLLVIR